VTVPPAGRALRADRIVADAAGLSRSFVQRLIEEGRLTLDGRAIKSNTLLEPGTQLELDVPPPTPLDAEPDDIPLSVVYEDDDVLVIDKPAGRSSHAAGPRHTAQSPASSDRASCTGWTATQAG